MNKLAILKTHRNILILISLVNLSWASRTTSARMAQESSQPTRKAESKTESADSNQKRHFEITQMGEIRDEDGTHLAFAAFKAADGTKLTVEHHEFESELQAQEYFQKTVGKAPKVVVRAKKTNAKGAITGERAQVILESTAVSGPLQAVLWTSGANFYEVFSTSLPDVLECEKRLSE